MNYHTLHSIIQTLLTVYMQLYDYVTLYKVLEHVTAQLP